MLYLLHQIDQYWSTYPLHSTVAHEYTAVINGYWRTNLHIDIAGADMACVCSFIETDVRRDYPWYMQMFENVMTGQITAYEGADSACAVSVRKDYTVLISLSYRPVTKPCRVKTKTLYSLIAGYGYKLSEMC